MNAVAKSKLDAFPAAAASAGSAISTADLLARLAAHAGKQLIFSYEGSDIRPGYHVTEVKDGLFSALDCGANPESWRETFIQLWDIAENPERGHMPVGKFLAIMRKVAEHVPFDPSAKLTFEVSDGQSAIRLFQAGWVTASDDTVRVELQRSPSSCKPRDRWLIQPNPTACCGPQAATQTACCPAA